MINEINSRKQSKKLDNLIVMNGEIDNLPTFDDKINFVLSRFSLMYSKNLQKLFSNLYDLMVLNGRILILANFATFKNPENESKIKNFPIPLILQIGNNSVEIKNYANSLIDYRSAFSNNGFRILDEKQFESIELSVSKSFDFYSEVSFKYVVFSLIKDNYF